MNAHRRLVAAWAGRPRDTRDTLFLLAVTAWTLLPQTLQVPLWCSALAYAALFWRARLAWLGAALPSRWLMLLALTGATIGTAISHQTLMGKSAGLTLLVVLAALKTLELRARRDATVVFFLGFFLVLANFLNSQSLGTALMMGLSVWSLLAALVLAHMPLGRPTLRQAMGLSARLLLTGTPLILALFMFFPRVAPLWAMPGDGQGRTGLSDELHLGQVAELAQDDSIALRLKFAGPTPLPPLLYFRGPVLSEPDGVGWRMRHAGPTSLTQNDDPPEPARSDGTRVRYEMTAEPLRIATLPLLETAMRSPLSPDGRPRWLRSVDDTWAADRPINDRIRVVAEAELDGPVHDPGWKPAPNGTLAADNLSIDRYAMARYLTLPAGRHARTLAWAQQWRDQAGLRESDAARLAQRLLDHIRRENFVYTLVPGKLGPDPVDEFWLDSRAGFCEHYASTFVVIMRGWGIPTRLVTGYQGGEVNPINGVLEVRQRDAHAWAEYWHPQRGWVRIDPTAAVAPERIERHRRLPARRGLVDGTMAELNPAMFEQVRALWSAFDHRWNQWVLGYTQQRQMDLLQNLGWDFPDTADLGRIVGGLLAAAALLAAGWAKLSGRIRKPDDAWLDGYALLRETLGERGLDVPDHLPPASLAGLLRERYGDQAQAQALASHVEALAHWRYQAGGSTRPLKPLLRAALAAAQRLPIVPATPASPIAPGTSIPGKMAG